MAFNKDNLFKRYKDLFSSKVNKISSFIKENPAPLDVVVKPIQKSIQSYGETHPTAAGRIIKYAEPAAQKTVGRLSQLYKPVKLPTAVVKADSGASTLQKLPYQASAGVYNYLLKPLAQGVINFPTNYVGGITKTGLGLANMRTGEEGGARQTLSGIGQVGSSIMDIDMFSAAPNVAKTAGKNALEQGFKSVVAQGFKTGAKYGGLYGLFSGFEQNEKNSDLYSYAEQIAKSTLQAGAVGGIAGGALAGGGYVVGKIFGKMYNALKSKGMNDQQAKKAMREFTRDELGRFAKQEYTPKKTEPTYYGDLRESIGLSRDGDYIPSIGLTTREISSQNKMMVSEEADALIQRAHEQIGKNIQESEMKSTGQVIDDLYTQWVDRYNPILKASKKVKTVLKGQQAELRPEYDPEYLVRRLTGAGGIADYRFRTELNPILNRMDNLGISKIDMDTYLVNKRMVGFGTAGRDIYGSDPEYSQKVVNALEQKYGNNIKEIAAQFYQYQDKGLSELSDFFTPQQMNAMRSQNPDYAPLYRVMDEMDDYLGLPTRKTQQPSQPIKRIKGSTRQIESPVESIIGNTFRQRAAIEKNRVAKSIVQLQDITDLGFEQVKKADIDTITIWNNGQKQYWKVGKDIADVAKGANEEMMNTVFKIIQTPAAIMRQGATGRNPEFMIPNVIRDQLDAGVTSKYGYIPFVDYVSGFKSMITNDDVYQRWQQSGAKIDLGQMSGKKSVQAMFDEKTAKKGLAQWITETLDFMGKYSEQPTRVGLFKRAYKKTGNELLAMMESRDATVDFARMGSKMKVFNSIIPFLNVGVQGFDKLIRAVKNNPGKVLLNASIYGAIPAATLTLNNLRDYAEEYFEIPQYVKDSNFVLVKGRNEDGTVDYLTYPKGNVLPVITNPIQSFIEFVYDADQVSFQEMALNVLSETLPVLGEGKNPREIAIRTFGQNLPQFVKPTAEDLFNKSFYLTNEKGEAKDIVPDYLKGKEPYQQAYEFTPKMYKTIGAVLNVSPLRVKNFLEGHFAGYVKVPAEMIDTLYSISRGEKPDPNRIPVLRRFFAHSYESNKKETKKEETPRTPLQERLFGKAKAAGEELTIPEDPREAKILYDQAMTEIRNARSNRIKYQYDQFLTEDKRKEKLDDELERNVKAVQTINQIRSQRPELFEKDTSLPETIKELTVVFDDAQSVVDKYEDKKTKIIYGDGDDWDKRDKLDELERDYNFAKNQLDQINKQYPDKVFEIELPRFTSGGGSKVEERAEWVVNQLKGLEGDKRQEMINRLWDKKVLTSGSNGTAAYILENYDIDVGKYTGKGKGGYSAKGKKGKKITLKTVTYKPPTLRSSKVSRSYIKTPVIRRASKDTYKITPKKLSKSKLKKDIVLT